MEALCQRGAKVIPAAEDIAESFLGEHRAQNSAVGAHGHHHGTGADLQGLAAPAHTVNGIDLGVAGLLTDATHLRLGVAALGAQSAHQGIDLAPPARRPVARLICDV